LPVITERLAITIATTERSTIATALTVATVRGAVAAALPVITERLAITLAARRAVTAVGALLVTATAVIPERLAVAIVAVVAAGAGLVAT
ncbi:hypothetical protein, partial [Leucobacter sp. G161]|uniref:hypothetical protein n=1 Tax=Leucobacter sp. G161 TaxID=663704 RepID=UPI000A6040E2